MAVTGVRYIPLEVTAGDGMNKLPLAAAWIKGTRDLIRDEMLETLRERLGVYAELA
ncbi:hypothetical protein [Paramagnetospirillum magneticum]|uniref:hypothetical protein n=1 Tax=Paramagnetospirillum magneticum TaxID=84159 RepID=UPI0018D47305|nr:hypothetical protein [Paramagnetospirillum magneticum]